MELSYMLFPVTQHLLRMFGIGIALPILLLQFFPHHDVKKIIIAALTSCSEQSSACVALPQALTGTRSAATGGKGCEVRSIWNSGATAACIQHLRCDWSGSATTTSSRQIWCCSAASTGSQHIRGGTAASTVGSKLLVFGTLI